MNYTYNKQTVCELGVYTPRVFKISGMISRIQLLSESNVYSFLITDDIKSNFQKVAPQRFGATLSVLLKL